MAERSERPPHVEGRRDVLDARSRDPSVAAALDDWLALQELLCFQPERASHWLAEAGGDPVRVVRRVRDVAPPPPSELAARRARLAQLGVVALPLGSAGYPLALRWIADPPPLLLIRGDAAALGRAAVAIVGTRAPSAYGRGVARELAGVLARAGVVVVSGLARGIDAAAHEGALDAGGTTVAVQACGPDFVYPPEHAHLADRIAERGAVVSELPPGRAPLAFHFPLRNRVISALARVVVVVEARAPRSGSLITARHALEQGREVMAVPGEITSPRASGPNGLLRDGARPLTEPADVLAALGLDATTDRADDASARGDAVPREPGAARLLAAVRDQPGTPDELLSRLAWAPRELALRLVELELDGAVVTDRDGRVHASPARGR